MRNHDLSNYFTSSKVWGSEAPSVSGKITAKQPPITEEAPNTISGIKLWNVSKPAMKGAAKPPILDAVDPNPTAVLRMRVGQSSAMYK